MSDLLSSASLLLTLIALLYGLWYQQIVSAIEIAVESQPADRKPAHKYARSVQWTKAVPLAIATLVLTAVFAPESLAIVIASLKSIAGFGWFRHYDAVSTSLVLVNLGSALFSAHLLSLVIKLRMKIRKLNPW